FWAYYLSALDAHGKFQRGQGDPKLLFNSEHPDPKDTLHKYAVDDGYGWMDEKGERWAFVAYYNSWGQWRMVKGALNALARAYTLTDDVRYAHKAGVLLDRIADVYPEMDMSEYLGKMRFEHSDGSSHLGRIEGSIWETDVGEAFALAYDRVFDGLAADPSLVAFLSGQAQKFKLGDKSAFAAVQKNIEDNLLLEIVQGVRDCRLRGNQGMHQVSMAAAAIALDRQPLTNELLDWVFQPGELVISQRRNTGGNVPFVINHTMCRDGMGSEGAPGYSCWGLTLFTLAELLERYPAYTKNNMFRDFPKYKQCFVTPLRWLCLGQTTPSIGDSGACGAWKAVGTALPQLLTVFRVYRDPLMARRIFELCGKKPGNIPGDIYDEDPSAIARDVARLASESAATLQPQNLNGFGLAIVQTPAAQNGRALWMYYGRNTGHGHRDRLNIGLYAKNLDLLPDLGYPEYASGRPMDRIWERNCIAHNVVIVDDAPQQSSYTGHLLLFDGEGQARVIEAEGPGVFPGVTTYRRLSVLVDASETDGYVVDFFRVRGGGLHRQ
ncbi:MAG: heparinase, partial [Planctomycetes bacterium]|nr:heparinase [Planctomycetota bacterium]